MEVCRETAAKEQTWSGVDKHDWGFVGVRRPDPEKDRNVVFRLVVADGDGAAQLQHLLRYASVVY